MTSDTRRSRWIPSFIDITGTGTPVLQDTDDSTFFLDTGAWLGSRSTSTARTYTSLYFSTNGLITFNGPTGDFANQDLSSDRRRCSTIAPYWDDLETFNGWRCGLLPGPGLSAHPRVEQRRSIIFTSGPITFEAVLNSSDNTIQFNYGNLAGGVSAGQWRLGDRRHQERQLLRRRRRPAAGLVQLRTQRVRGLVPQHQDRREPRARPRPPVYSFHLDQGQSARSSSRPQRPEGAVLAVSTRTATCWHSAARAPRTTRPASTTSWPATTVPTTSRSRASPRPGSTWSSPATRTSTPRRTTASRRPSPSAARPRSSVRSPRASRRSMPSMTSSTALRIRSGRPTRPRAHSSRLRSAQPGSPLNNPFGLNLAYDGTYLYLQQRRLQWHRRARQARSRHRRRAAPDLPGRWRQLRGHCLSGRQDLRDRPLLGLDRHLRQRHAHPREHDSLRRRAHRPGGRPGSGRPLGRGPRGPDRHALRDRPVDRCGHQVGARPEQRVLRAGPRLCQRAVDRLRRRELRGPQPAGARHVRSGHAGPPGDPAHRRARLHLRPRWRRTGKLPRTIPIITRSMPMPATRCTSPPRRRPAGPTSSSTTSTPSSCSTTRIGNLVADRRRQRVRRQELGHRFHDSRRCQRHLVRRGRPVAEYSRRRPWANTACWSRVPPVPWPPSP